MGSVYIDTGSTVVHDKLHAQTFDNELFGNTPRDSPTDQQRGEQKTGRGGIRGAFKQLTAITPSCSSRLQRPPIETGFSLSGHRVWETHRPCAVLKKKLGTCEPHNESKVLRAVHLPLRPTGFLFGSIEALRSFFVFVFFIFFYVSRLSFRAVLPLARCLLYYNWPGNDDIFGSATKQTLVTHSEGFFASRKAD